MFITLFIDKKMQPRSISIPTQRTYIPKDGTPIVENNFPAIVKKFPTGFSGIYTHK
jgi:hypothetical protein